MQTGRQTRTLTCGKETACFRMMLSGSARAEIRAQTIGFLRDARINVSASHEAYRLYTCSGSHRLALPSLLHPDGEVFSLSSFASSNHVRRDGSYYLRLSSRLPFADTVSVTRYRFRVLQSILWTLRRPTRRHDA
jgi:hypothetical protein